MGPPDLARASAAVRTSDGELHPILTAALVVLLAVPQATHYLLDRWIWRVGPDNPALAEQSAWPDALAPTKASHRPQRRPGYTPGHVAPNLAHQSARSSAWPLRPLPRAHPQPGRTGP